MNEKIKIQDSLVLNILPIMYSVFRKEAALLALFTYLQKYAMCLFGLET